MAVAVLSAGLQIAIVVRLRFGLADVALHEKRCQAVRALGFCAASILSILLGIVFLSAEQQK